MDMTGTYLISTSRERVWAALNDPLILGQVMPGCETLTAVPEGGFEAVAVQNIGPLKARFKGKVLLDDLNPPESYTLRGEGTGGAAGFARGEAKVFLTETDGGTLLLYEVNARVGGKLAQIGQRLVDTTAKKLVDQFFLKFSTILADEPATEPPCPFAPAETPSAMQNEPATPFPAA